MVAKTKNFKVETDPRICCTCGNPLCDEPSVKQWVLDKVQLIRDDYGKPMILTSAGRCQFHPSEVTKNEPGDHQLLYAVDVACDNPMDETKLKVLAGRHGATRVAGSYEDGFVHMAWTPTERKDVPTWEY